MQVQLISEDVQFEDVQFTLAQDPIVLGRSVRADVQVMHPLISRLHCEWALVDGELRLKIWVPLIKPFSMEKRSSTPPCIRGIG